MSYEIAGPTGSLDDEEAAREFFDFVQRHKLPCPRLEALKASMGSASLVPLADLPYLMEELLAAGAFYRSLNERPGTRGAGDNVDRFARRFAELTRDAAERGAELKVGYHQP